MKKISLLLTLCAIIPTQLWAADATTPPKLGKLFFSPNERATLDVIRQNSKAPEKIITAQDIEEDAPEITAEAVSSAPVMLKGYIQRSDGKNTIWVNNQAMPEKSANPDWAVGTLKKNTGAVPITVNGQEKKTVLLKAGQIYDPSTGQIYNHTTDVPKPVSAASGEEKSIAQNISDSLGLTSIKDKVAETLSFITNPQKSTPGKTSSSP